MSDFSNTPIFFIGRLLADDVNVVRIDLKTQETSKMKKLFIVFNVTLSLCIFTFGVTAQEAKPTMESVAFIAGCWEINKPERQSLTNEQWMSPVGGAMIGMARSVRNGKMGSYEYLRIVQDETGIHYIAKPSQSKSETSFKLVKWAANEAVFENPAHDFPQRIIYKLAGTDTLTARIEGTMNGKPTGMDFPYVRGKCH